MILHLYPNIAENISQPIFMGAQGSFMKVVTKTADDEFISVRFNASNVPAVLSAGIVVFILLVEMYLY